MIYAVYYEYGRLFRLVSTDVIIRTHMPRDEIYKFWKIVRDLFRVETGFVLNRVIARPAEVFNPLICPKIEGRSCCKLGHVAVTDDAELVLLKLRLVNFIVVDHKNSPI